ncbi:MAG: hypothetical protein PF638_14800 [Candidatus Delongbacteria bacterium]|jgi:hypothetical protein|nr:hypothetical protein [Candidatus Delongbacteria bacterium]
MKKLILGLLILTAIFTAPLNASSDPYTDWVLVGTQWVYVGDGDITDPTPPPSRG